MDTESNPVGGAVLSSCGRYRYHLWRDVLQLQGDADPFRILFVMLNPSTADAFADDPTIRKCRGFADRDRATRFDVVNLFAFRATDPRELVPKSGYGPMNLGGEGPFDLVGPDNNDTIRRVAAEADRIVVAWGAWGERFPERVAEVVSILHGSCTAEQAAAGGRRGLYCLGTTRAGEPCHPLMLSYATPIVPWDLS